MCSACVGYNPIMKVRGVKMYGAWPRGLTWLIFLSFLACGDESGTSLVPPGDPCLNQGTEGATATCLSPTMSPEYYVAQAEKYFDTLDTDADPESVPNYSENVARWEWPPWVLLTGLGRDDMISTAKALKTLDPSTVPIRDCRAFDSQPFARCTVSFEYDEEPGGHTWTYWTSVIDEHVAFHAEWLSGDGERGGSHGEDP